MPSAECTGPSLAFVPLHGTKDCAQDDSLLVPGLMGSLFKHSVHLAAGKSLFQQFAAIRQMPSRRQVCTNLPRSTTVVRFA